MLEHKTGSPIAVLCVVARAPSAFFAVQGAGGLGQWGLVLSSGLMISPMTQPALWLVESWHCNTLGPGKSPHLVKVEAFGLAARGIGIPAQCYHNFHLKTLETLSAQLCDDEKAFQVI